MRLTHLAAGVLLLVGSAGLAGAQDTLDCYGTMTQSGVVARRDFHDARGAVSKVVYYIFDPLQLAPASGGFPTKCPEHLLRVFETREYERDRLGRATVERVLNAQGQLTGSMRYEYAAEAKQALRTISFGPEGDRRFEMRRVGTRPSWLYFDDRGKVVGVMFVPPVDVDYAIAWGAAVDGWQCGVGFARMSLYVNLRNENSSAVSARFTGSFETELRDANRTIVPLLSGVEKQISGSTTGDAGRLIDPGEIGSQAYDLRSRYGQLPRGHYSLRIRYPHPTTRGLLASNAIEFDVR